MAQKTRPRDDRESANLKSWESPATPVDAPASCPLLQTVTLLPLRYGRAETAPTGSAAGMPYTLKSRPMGYRMLRDGYIYIYDEDAGQLAEYEYRDNILGGGPMEYPRDHVLYVGFADIQWTAKKKAQVTDSEEERHHWMQRVNLGSASPLSGGEHLLTVEQAKQWVAEFAEDYQPEPIDDSYPEETTPYLWENQPYYHKTRVGKLLQQQGVDDPDECLCLVLRDDVGVMLDLADHQDLVVGWLDRWANEGDNERNYVLGALIESMTLINTESLDAILESSRDPAIRAIRDDLESLDPDVRAETKEALLEILNQPRQGSYPSPNDPSLHPELRAEVEALRQTANRHNAHGVYVGMQRAVERWYFRQSLENADPGFVDRDLEGLQALAREQRTALKKVLEGQGFGHRGINRLIDRGAMDQVMKEHREKLARWQAQLDVITEDRVDMLCSERLHRATWYFDLDDTEQVEAALDLQYACLKDICRAETAAEEILAWLENNPQYTHPLFQALPLQDQAPEGELARTYSTMASAGYSVVTRSASWIDQWRQAEAGKLPDLERLSERIQIKAEAIGDVLSPAVSMSMARSLQTLYDGIERQSLPALDELFRDLPLFFKKQMLKAIEAGEAEFRFASDGELASFREDVRQMLVLRERLSAIRHEYKIIKANQGHKSAEAAAKRAEFRQAREDHRTIGTRVAGALSPVDETTSAIRLEDGAPGRAMLSVVAPAAAQEEVRRLTGQFRKGLATAPRVDLISDGLGWVVFAAQAVNLWSISHEFFSAESGRRPRLSAVASSFIATLGAGFLASQSLMDTAYSARAKSLIEAWQHSALKTVHIRMGQLHVGLGSFAYLLGAASSGIAFVGHQSEWQEAVRRGNAGAQVGAAMGMAGSGGLAVTQSYGLYQTGRMGYQALRVKSGAAARRAAWATAGTRLSSLFFRLNLAGLAFTVFELAGTWVYNRFNLDKRDKWLLTVPWSKEPEYIHNGSLAEYEKALAGVSNSVDVVHQDGEKGRKQVILNCYSLPNNVLEERLGAEPPTRVALAAWQVKPARNIRGYVTEETWVSCTDALLPSLQLTEGEDHLQLTFTSPERKGFWFFMKAPYLALMVKVSTRISDDEHVEETYLLKLNSSSDKPVTPTEDSPKGDIQWLNVPDPLMSLENL